MLEDSLKVPRVIHFMTGGFSGATQVAIDLCLAANASQSRQVELVLRKKSNTIRIKSEALQDQGFDVEVVPRCSHIETIWALKRICEQWHADNSVANGFSEHIWGRLAGLWAKVSTLVHVKHNSKERYKAWRLQLSQWLAAHMAAIAGVSEGVKSSLIGRGLLAEKYVSIANCIKVSRFFTVPRLSWAERHPHVMIASQYARQKDQPTLIQALAIQIKQSIQTRHSFAGLGGKRLLQHSQKLAAQSGLTHQIDFLGYVSNLPEVLAQHQIFVLSTHYKGMPLDLIEAIASGCACIGTHMVGVREVIEDEVTDLLVPENDPSDLAEAIALLFENPEMSENLGHAAKSAVAYRFILQVMNDHYKELLLNLFRKKTSS